MHDITARNDVMEIIKGLPFFLPALIPDAGNVAAE